MEDTMQDLPEPLVEVEEPATDLIEASIENLRERAEELAPYYDEYVQLREAIRSLEKIQRGVAPRARRRSYPSTRLESSGRPPFLEGMIIEALQALGGGHYDTRQIYDKVREAHEDAILSSIVNKVQTMGREGVLDKPLRGRYQLPAIQEGE